MDDKDLIENTTEQEEDSEKPKVNKKKKITYFIVGIIFLLCLSMGGYAYMITRTYSDYELIEGTGMESASDSKYSMFQEKIVKYSKDGISLLNHDGKSVWAETYSMKTPKVVMNENYLAVADVRGNGVYLFDGTGKVQNLTMPYPICDIELSEHGVIAAVLEDQKMNYIQLYDKEGTQIVDSNVSIEQSGYPLDIALSDNAICLAVSYVTIDGVDAKNTIGFYNFGSVGQNANSNKYVGGFYYTDTVFPKIEFIDSTTVCAYGDNKAVLYSVKEKPSEKTTEIKFDSEIRSIFSNNKYIGFVCKNAQNPSEGKYLVKVYNTRGKLIFNKAVDMDYNKVKLDGSHIILVGDYECTILRMMGKQKFYSHFDMNITDVIPLAKFNRYLLVSSNDVTVIKLK